MVLFYRHRTGGVWAIACLPTQMYMFLPVWALPAGKTNTNIILWCAVSVSVLALHGVSVDADIDTRRVVAWASSKHSGTAL